MTIFFTEQEKEWIIIEKFHWKVKRGCPEKIRKPLQKKIDQFYNGEHYGNNSKRKNNK